jgi:hypothetical protein
MTILKNTKILWLLLAILVGFSSCKKDEEDEPVGLEVKVNDLNGAAQSGAKVSLYSSTTDWENEQNPVVSGQTGSDGTVRFNDVSGTFYVDVVNGSLNNWQEGAASTSVSATANTLTNTTVSVSESVIGMIASAAGKAWKLKDGHPLQACNDDDIDTFYKSGLFKDDNGSESCGEAVVLDNQGSWALSQNESKFTFSGVNYGSGLTLDLISVSATEMVFSLDLGGGAALEIILVSQ